MGSWWQSSCCSRRTQTPSCIGLWWTEHFTGSGLATQDSPEMQNERMCVEQLTARDGSTQLWAQQSELCGQLETGGLKLSPRQERQMSQATVRRGRPCHPESWLLFHSGLHLTGRGCSMGRATSCAQSTNPHIHLIQRQPHRHTQHRGPSSTVQWAQTSQHVSSDLQTDL